MTSEPPRVPLSGDRQSDQSKWVRGLNSLKDGVTTFVIVCAVAWVFEKWASVDSVEAAKNLQGHLDRIIRSFSPNQPLTYIGDAYAYLSNLILDIFKYILPQKFFEYVFSFQIMGYLIWVVSLAAIIIGWPVVVLAEAYHNGHFAEAIISVAIWLMVLLIAWRNFKNSDQANRHFNFPYLVILITTYLFLWAVEGTMLGASYLLQKYIALGGLAVIGSVWAAFISWASRKSIEHSLTEQALHWAEHIIREAQGTKR
jgi:hypothetical protein